MATDTITVVSNWLDGLAKYIFNVKSMASEASAHHSCGGLGIMRRHTRHDGHTGQGPCRGGVDIYTHKYTDQEN